MNNISRLTIPMDTSLRNQLKKRASELGFDSSQALLRYVSKTIVDGREVTFGEDEWGEPPAHVVKRWETELANLPQQLKTGKAKIFSSPEDLMSDLRGK